MMKILQPVADQVSSPSANFESLLLAALQPPRDVVRRPYCCFNPVFPLYHLT